jgi:O-antigen ligase
MSYKSEIIDRKLSFYVIFFFIIQALNATLKSLFVFGDSVNLSLLFGFVLLLVLARNLRYVAARSFSMLVISYLVFILLYSISALQSIYRGDPLDVLIGSSALWTFIFWIPMGLTVYSIRNMSILYEYLLKGSHILLLILLLNLLPVIFFEEKLFSDGREYNMFLSYALVLPALVYLNEYFNKKNFFILLVSSIVILVIFFYGSRGALLCVISFIGLKVFLKKEHLKKNIFLLIFILLIGVVIISYSSYLVQMLDEYGVKSYTLDKIANGNMHTGRGYIWESGVNLIAERPFFGYGLGGEFYQMTYEAHKLLGTALSDRGVEDLSPHQGFLQLALNFGVIFGLIAGLYIVLSIFKLRTTDDLKLNDIIIISYTVFVVPAMTVSDGIFTKPGIAIYIYLILFYKRHRLHG